ncbi:hypothetical protein ACQPXM_07660 [Kribbella sp. CA-253562]|uniref:hypothetical protein n=1 Tax=Kribbella sp. CA-253562 TaxID=3239942 RepID=UPI003D8AF0DA
MIFAKFVDELAEQIDGLAPRSKAAVYWLSGAGLLTGLDVPERWAEWFVEARSVGYGFVTTGEVDQRTAGLWEAARVPTGSDASQLLNSTLICLSTPLGIALDPETKVGTWAEHALFPTMQSAALKLFDDVAFPDDDDDLDIVFAQDEVQAAAEYCRQVVARLAALSGPDASAIEILLRGAEVLDPGRS